MPNDRGVRRATPADSEVLARLRYEFRAERRPTTESRDEFIARCVSWMRPRLAPDAAWRAWILEVGGEAVGNIWLQLVEKLPNPGIEPETNGYVSSFYVHADHRNGGAGSMLLDAALGYARDADIESCYLWPTERSRPLYERNGFAASMSVLTREFWQSPYPR